MKTIRTFMVILVFVLLLSNCLPQAVIATETKQDDYSTLFQQVKAAGDNLTEVSPALSDAFYRDHVVFCNALAQEDASIWEKVGDAIIANNTGSGNDLEFLKFVLEGLASDGFTQPGRSAFVTILMGFHPDVTDADDAFIITLFNAMRHSDGISADKLSIYMYELFQEDTVRLLHFIMEEDEAFQTLMVTMIHYQGFYNDDAYPELLNNLSTNTDLSETEQAFIGQLFEKLNENTPPVETEATTEPAQQIIATEDTKPAATDPTIMEPANPHTNENKIILPLAVIAIVLVCFGIIAIKSKKQSYK